MEHRSATQGERGSAIIMAIIMMVVVAMLVASISIMSSRSTERSRDAARRVSNDATIQTAVTRLTYAFQNDLGSEQDYYSLSGDDLRQSTRVAAGQARVLTSAQLPRLPAELANVQINGAASVWEHTDQGGRHRLVAVRGARLDNVWVEETTAVDRSACTSAGLPRQVCETGSARSYWQPVRIVMPDITGNEAPNVVVYIRSFIGSAASGNYSKASFARAELRPGRFADYQQISDGNVRIGSGASINGPVHSNGLADGSFSTVQEATGLGSRWILAEPGVRCTGAASLSIASGNIRDRTGRCNSVGATGQNISFLRAIDAIETIRTSARRSRPGTMEFNAATSRRGNESLSEPYHTAWQVTISGSTMTVNYPNGARRGTYTLGRVNAFVFDEDVRVHGRISPDRRITIAAERVNGATASIFVDGDLVKGDPRTSSIGLIAQGDVVLWMDRSGGTVNCPIRQLQAAIVAATGGVTIPTKYTTNELQSTAPNCRNRVLIDGSLAGHRPPTLIWTWTTSSGRSYHAGFTGSRDYRWDTNLKRNPPPFFPLTGSWQPFQVREANIDCLVDSTRISDPKCR
jgi:hypothetical protein